jgi:peptide/nickel transport system permease protein
MDPLTGFEIFTGILARFWIVWIGIALIFAISIKTKRNTALYGKLFDSPIGMVGFALVLFWVLTALFADLIMTHNPLDQVSGMKNKVPGTPLRGAEEGEYQWYLLGGDHLARDVFSRVVAGSRIVLKIAPLATLFAFMVGITLGLPAGYFGKRVDTILSFLANLILAFPVILLFYLLVTPEIIETGMPQYMAGAMFLIPIIFMMLLWQSRFHIRPKVRNKYVFWTLLIGGWIYLGAAFNMDPLVIVRNLFAGSEAVWQTFPKGLVYMQSNILIVFVSVVFVNSPTVFRIVRGLTMDIQTRDYVAAAQTRGEGPWYIMLWEILPNARGPLIVDFCLRIGYTIILLGTLGFFGLGLESESPDWGTTINSGRKLLTIYAHPALPPALALMSLVLGLNLLADGLREQSLKD